MVVPKKGEKNTFEEIINKSSPNLMNTHRFKKLNEQEKWWWHKCTSECLKPVLRKIFEKLLKKTDTFMYKGVKVKW